jgi:MarR-like DNA-binding transcriptional regulator SgrR of sgrS sRNA
VGDELRALLARPEAAILARGQPGVGCGAFKPGAATGERRVLVAWEGFAGGRPWMQEVRLILVAKARAEAAFRFGEV